MTTRRAFRSQWVPHDEPKPEPTDSRMTRARKLPRFGPGIVITVPLSLLPEYLELYQLKPNGVKPGRILLVKRVPKDQAHG